MFEKAVRVGRKDERGFVCGGCRSCQDHVRELREPAQTQPSQPVNKTPNQLKTFTQVNYSYVYKPFQNYLIVMYRVFSENGAQGYLYVYCVL